MASYQQTVIADGPLLYWPCQETGGTTVSDASGNGHTGTINGAVTKGTATGLAGVGTGFTFPGAATAYLSIASFAAINLTGAFSYECWFNATTLASANVLMSKGVTGSSGGLQLYQDDGGSGPSGPGFVKCNNGFSGSTVVVSATAQFGTGTLVHMVVTRDGSNNVQMFRDGSRIVNSTSATGIQSTTDPFCVGARSVDSSISLPYTGLITQVAVYNFALTTTQVSNHYAARNTASSGGGGSAGPVGSLIAQAITQSFVTQLGTGRPPEKGLPPGIQKKQPPIPPPSPQPPPSRRFPGTEYPPES